MTRPSDNSTGLNRVTWLDDPISAKEIQLMKGILDYREKFGGTVLISNSPISEWKKNLASDHDL